MTAKEEIPNGIGYDWLECLTCKKESEKIRKNNFLYKGGGGGSIFIDGDLDYFIKYDTFLLVHSHELCFLKHRTSWEKDKPWFTDGKEMKK